MLRKQGKEPDGHFGLIPLDCIERVGAFKDLKLGPRDVWMKLRVAYVPPAGFESRSHLCRMAGLTWDELRKNTVALVDAGLLQVDVNSYTVILPELTKRGKEKLEEPTELTTEVELKPAADDTEITEVVIEHKAQPESADAFDPDQELWEQMNKAMLTLDDDTAGSGLKMQKAGQLMRDYTIKIEAEPTKADELRKEGLQAIVALAEGELQPAAILEPEPEVAEPEPEAATNTFYAEYRAFNERREKAGMGAVSVDVFYKAANGDPESIDKLNYETKRLKEKENPAPKPDPKPVAEEVKTEPETDPYDDGLGW